jgi:hypothetical protein
MRASALALAWCVVVAACGTHNDRARSTVRADRIVAEQELKDRDFTNRTAGFVQQNKIDEAKLACQQRLGELDSVIAQVEKDRGFTSADRERVLHALRDERIGAQKALEKFEQLHAHK